MEQSNSSNGFLEEELKKVISNKKYTEPLNKVLGCVYLAIFHKGHDLKILDTKDVTTLGDYFALVSVDNISQALGISDDILIYMKKFGMRLISREGNKDTDWILMDYGDFVIHIFVNEARMRYDLDGLWNAAKKIDIPEEFYLHPTLANTQQKKVADVDDVDDFV